MTISELWIYPIKGLAGVSVQSAAISSRGLVGDRRFMLVDEQSRFITQRTHPELTQFQVAVEDGKVAISHSECGSIRFSLTPQSGPAVPVVVWQDEVSAVVASSEVNDFFSTALKQPVRLVGMPESSTRQIDLSFSDPGQWVSFADGYPILVLGTASIEELNSRLDQPVPLNRFRANVLVSGAQPWEEDSWTCLSFENTHLDLVKPCARCIVIRTDQRTGERTPEPMQTLLTYRKVDSKVLVGMNAVPDASAIGAFMQVGQEVRSV